MTTNAPVGPPIWTREPPSAETRKPATIAVYSPRSGVTPLAIVAPPGRPAIVSFSTPTCIECKNRQAPALTRLAAALGDAVTIRSLSALEHPDLVDQIGILTVPATVVLDRRGTVRHLNLGYASEQKLRDQLATVG